MTITSFAREEMHFETFVALGDGQAHCAGIFPKERWSRVLRFVEASDDVRVELAALEAE